VTFDNLTTVSSVTSRAVEWLWPGRLPLGKIAMLDGDPGLGKSNVTLDLAARVSTGSPMPFETERTPISDVILLSAEDDIEDTIRPRLEACGADVDRIHVMAAIKNDAGECLPSLPQHYDELRWAIADTGAKLVVIDPVVAYLDERRDSHRDQDVRGALHPLKELAQAQNATVLLVRHLNKSVGANPLYRGGGSIGWVGTARAGLLVAKHPEDESLRVLAAVKMNLAEMPPSLVFRVVGWELDSRISCVKWVGSTEHNADSLLVETDSAIGEAMTFLREELANGPVPANDIKKLAKERDIAPRTLDRAKASLRVVSRKEVDRWVWELRHVQNSGVLGDVGDVDSQVRQERHERQEIMYANGDGS
jgi:putative DNA primase/helicase